MKYDKYKFFWKANDSGKDIQLIFCDEDNRDYYLFTKECRFYQFNVIKCVHKCSDWKEVEVIQSYRELSVGARQKLDFS